MRLICLTLAMVLMLGGCARIAESPVNPFNWFGREDAEDGATAQTRPQNIRPLVPPSRIVQSVDQRPLVASVTNVEVTPTNGGFIVRASGVATAAGAFSAQLTNGGATSNEIILDFRAFQGQGPGGGNVSVARFFTAGELGSARTVTVRATSNQVSARR